MRVFIQLSDGNEMSECLKPNDWDRLCRMLHINSEIKYVVHIHY